LVDRGKHVISIIVVVNFFFKYILHRYIYTDCSTAERTCFVNAELRNVYMFLSYFIEHKHIYQKTMQLICVCVWAASVV
jgi:hypothetical protein